MANFMNLEMQRITLSKPNWNRRFETWAQPLSDTEDEKCENATSVIRSALNADSTLSKINPNVSLQGSYRANTNVRNDSDVDIRVTHPTIFFDDYPPGISRGDFGFGSASLSFRDFKTLVGSALYTRFGYASVSTGDKAYNVHENTYRIKADVLPAFEYRLYFRNANGTFSYISGIRFITDSGRAITNWPEQSYQNGVAKNGRTGKKYKQVIRVLKGLRNEMQEKSLTASANVASSLIESAIYNVPDAHFVGDSLYDVLVNVVRQAWYLLYDNQFASWTEGNGIKDLFSPDQPWTSSQARDFFWAVLDYIGAVGNGS